MSLCCLYMLYLDMIPFPTTADYVLFSRTNQRPAGYHDNDGTIVLPTTSTMLRKT